METKSIHALKFLSSAELLNHSLLPEKIPRKPKNAHTV